MKKESMQGFLLGLTAALSGFLIYICAVQGYSFFSAGEVVTDKTVVVEEMVVESGDASPVGEAVALLETGAVE